MQNMGGNIKDMIDAITTLVIASLLQKRADNTLPYLNYRIDWHTTFNSGSFIESVLSPLRPRQVQPQ